MSEQVTESVDEEETEYEQVGAKWRQCMAETGLKVQEYVTQGWRWLMDPRRKTVVMVIVGVLAAVIAFFVIFVVLANVFPSWMDSLLYSNEELEILNHKYE
jgi:nucleoside recognition membrane protein YjiH